LANAILQKKGEGAKTLPSKQNQGAIINIS